MHIIRYSVFNVIKLPRLISNIKTKVLSLIFLLLFIFSLQLKAQDIQWLGPEEQPGKASLADIDWMVGYWSGTGLGGHCDEVWLPAVDNCMTGTFRLQREGRIVFTEYLMMYEEDETLTLKVKHFNRDLSPWEEKDEWADFRLIKLEGQTAWFNGLVLHREGDSLTITLAVKRKEGLRVEQFLYARQRL